MEATSTLLLELRDKLKLLQKQEVTFKAFVGFDGFIDRIQRAVKKKHSEKNEYFATIGEFADHLKSFSGISGQVELITGKIKMGGNAPILSNTLAGLNVDTTCLGTMGFPDIHPVFKEMNSHCKVISVSPPGISNALEFNDGKIIISELEMLASYDWNHIMKTCDMQEVKSLTEETNLFAFVDWVNLPHATDIWQRFLTSVIKPMAKKERFFLFDLCDPSRKSTQHIDEVLDLISDFSVYGKVTLGLNENETNKIWMALTGNPADKVPALEVAGQYIYQAMNIETLLIHPVDRTLIFTRSLTKNVTEGSSSEMFQHPYQIEMLGNLVTEPKLLTGGGDNLNAGFSLGLMAGYEIHHCMLLGMSASGAYIQNGVSPGVDELIAYIEKWAEKLNGISTLAQSDKLLKRAYQYVPVRRIGFSTKGIPYDISPIEKFKDRTDAARLLFNKLTEYKSNKDVIVIAILAGGVPVGYHLADMLNVPFDIIPCKKICHPSRHGHTIGSVSLSEISIHDNQDIPGDYVHHQVRQIRNDLKGRYKIYMGDKKPADLKGKTVILVDDRLKTGDTMLASIRSIKKQKPSKIIAVVPVTTVRASHQIMAEVDDFVCVIKTHDLDNTDDFYESLPRVSDDEAKKFLDLV
jgi:predicted phosphoribosyltransferase